jgi:hypothetical protein
MPDDAERSAVAEESATTPSPSLPITPPTIRKPG